MAETAGQVDAARKGPEDRPHGLAVAEDPEVHGVLCEGLGGDVADLPPVTGRRLAQAFRKSDLQHLQPFAVSSAAIGR